MSLLTHPEPADAEADRIRTAILNLSRRTFAAMLEAQRQGIDLLWHGQATGLHGLTPQQVCDALGEDAGKVFAFHGALTDFILTQATADGVSVDVAIPPFAFTVNADGTVTVSTEPYIPLP
jgi:hypothetical protein